MGFGRRHCQLRRIAHCDNVGPVIFSFVTAGQVRKITVRCGPAIGAPIYLIHYRMFYWTHFFVRTTGKRCP